MSIKHLREIPMGSPKYRWGIKISRFSKISRYISQTIQDSAVVTTEGEQKTAPKISIGTSFNDLEWRWT